jgi:hypothetical protein
MANRHQRRRENAEKRKAETGRVRFRPLSGQEAKELLESDPQSFVWRLADFLTQLGMSPDELRAELISGRLVAEGTPTKTGFADVCVNGEDLLRWLITKEGRGFYDRGIARKASH